MNESCSLFIYSYDGTMYALRNILITYVFDMRKQDFAKHTYKIFRDMLKFPLEKLRSTVLSISNVDTEIYPDTDIFHWREKKISS